MYQNSIFNANVISNGIKTVLKQCNNDPDIAKAYIMENAVKTKRTKSFEKVAPEVAAEYICLCIDIYCNQKGV